VYFSCTNQSSLMSLLKKIVGKFKRSGTPQQRGLALEIRVKQLFERYGKWNVQHDVKLYDSNENLSQIDVTYGYGIFKRYIECKSYENKPVPLEDVAKFKEVLSLNRVSPRRGMLVTNSTFTPRAMTIGIHCVDGNQLIEFEAYVEQFLWLKRFLWLIYGILIYYELFGESQYVARAGTNIDLVLSFAKTQILKVVEKLSKLSMNK
jgi:hypothetical protein